MILPGTGRGTAEGGGGASKREMPPEVITARRLRRSMSLPEVLLWQRLRRSPAGLRFRRQHPVEPYVVDFFCNGAALAIEIDGRRHDGGAAQTRDKVRDNYLHSRGLTIARVAAGDVLSDPNEVAQSIVAFALRPLHQPSAGPPPRSGEDQE